MLLLCLSPGSASACYSPPIGYGGTLVAEEDVPAGSPELYREPSGGGVFYRQSHLYCQSRDPGESALPGGGVWLFRGLGIEEEVI